MECLQITAGKENEQKAFAKTIRVDKQDCRCMQDANELSHFMKSGNIKVAQPASSQMQCSFSSFIVWHVGSRKTCFSSLSTGLTVAYKMLGTKVLHQCFRRWHYYRVITHLYIGNKYTLQSISETREGLTSLFWALFISRDVTQPSSLLLRSARR